MQHRRRHRFPIGVYATLLGALCWLAVPQLTTGFERGLLGAICLPLRAYAALLGPARAAAAGESDRRRVAELERRLQEAAVGLPPEAAADRQPVLCRVLEWRGLGDGGFGGGGLPCELLLDRSFAELRACQRWVTYGEHLLGFLARPGEGLVDPVLARSETADDRARVLLLNHPASASVPAALQMDEDQVLRCTVGPAGSVDRWPLRCGLWADPYTASQLSRSGGELRSLELAAGGGVPDGLLVGTCQVWGYQVGTERLPIGIYAQPGKDPRSISTVALWKSDSRSEGPAEGLRPLPARAREPVSLLWMPGPAGARSFAHGRFAVRFPEEAALVRGLRWLGTATGLGPGQARALAFADTVRTWSFILLPVAGEPVELRGRAVLREGSAVWVALAGEPPGGQRGQLFTGVNGLHSPAGLLVGDVLRVSADATRILVDGPELAGARPGGTAQSIFMLPEDAR